MRNVFLGIWICFLSATMMFGILFPFHGIILGGLGIVVGWSLIVEGVVSVNRNGRAYIVNPSMQLVDSFRDSLQKEIEQKPNAIYPSPKFLISSALWTSAYMDENDNFGPKENAKTFASYGEAYDYIEFVPIGKKRNWTKHDVTIINSQYA